MSQMIYKDDKEAVHALREMNSRLQSQIARIIVGQDLVVEQLVNCIFSRGHCLLIGVPGLAKTLLVNTLADVLGLSFKRIQFTPDLMPSDIVGTEILNEHRQFQFVQGPIFSNIILADEINRTPPKTQSALLEAMQERTVTAANRHFKLEEPFFVLATQNPIEQEGTYPLPEAQLDRFMFNTWLEYPSFQEEVSIVQNTTGDKTVVLEKVMTSEEILGFQALIRRVPVNENLVKYAVSVVTSSRPGNANAHELAKKYISWGAGPRASQYLITAAKTHAVLHGKYSPDIEDIRAIALPVLRHRLVRNYKAEAEGISVLKMVEEFLKVS
jgi:MoxR-like ATPase